MNRTSMLMPCAAVAAMLLALPDAASAGWFSRKKDTGSEEQKPGTARRRYHLHIPDKKTEQELLGLFNAKKMLSEDVRALTRINEEKKQNFSRIQEQLLKEFDIRETGVYEYDRDTRTIFVLAKKNVQQETAKDAPRRTEHLRLKDDAQQTRFLTLLDTRDRNLKHTEALKELLEEAAGKLARINEILSNKFALKSGRYYDYDRESMRLFEIVGPPPAGQ